MKVLFVFSGTSEQGVSPFVQEQADSLTRLGIKVDMFPIKKKGFKGYFNALLKLRSFLNDKDYDLVHGHFLWSVIIAGMSGHKNVVGTFHGSDVNDRKLMLLSRFVAHTLLKKVIIVNPKMADILKVTNAAIIPCGIDLNLFTSKTEETASHVKDAIKADYKNILFASRFDRPEKNYHLAKTATDMLRKEYQINLIELKGFSRKEVAYLLHHVDVLLLTSLWEGSPQVVKEAMACNLPIVTTDVGDVHWLFKDVQGCYITSYEADDVAETIRRALSFNRKTKGIDRIKELGLDLETTAHQIINVYRSILRKSGSV